MASVCSRTDLVGPVQKIRWQFFGRIAAKDETWARLYEPKLKRQSNEWKHPGSPRPKKVRLRIITCRRARTALLTQHSSHRESCQNSMWTNVSVHSKELTHCSSYKKQNSYARVSGLCEEWWVRSDVRCLGHVITLTQCAVIVMFIVAYDIDGVILHHAVPPRQTVNAAYNCKFL